jgi:gliding motility-associated-like protein
MGGAGAEAERPVPRSTVDRSGAPVSAAAAGTYSVVVTDINGCVADTTISTTIFALPTASISPIIPGCAPLCTDIYLSSPNNLLSYNWQLGNGSVASGNDTLLNRCYNNAGVYSISVVISDINGCSTTLDFDSVVTVYANPVADFTFGPQPTTILEPEINFINLSTGVGTLNYMWNFGDALGTTSSITNPSFTYTLVNSYTVGLTTMDNFGCIDSTYKTVIIDEDFTLYVPNAFSPNDDGVNDFFFPKGIGIDETKYQMWIYDRWGNMIFYTKDWNVYWDGRVQGREKIVQQDLYIYKIKAQSFKGEKRDLVGHVFVVK